MKCVCPEGEDRSLFNSQGNLHEILMVPCFREVKLRQDVGAGYNWRVVAPERVIESLKIICTLS